MKTIVVGYDDSKASGRALEHAATLAMAFESKLVVTSVAPVATSAAARSIGADPVESARDHLAELAAARSFLDSQGLRAEYVEAMGHPGESILAVAQEHSADMIVVGTRESGLLTRLLGGSVSGKVSQREGLAAGALRRADRALARTRPGLFPRRRRRRSPTAIGVVLRSTAEHQPSVAGALVRSDADPRIARVRQPRCDITRPSFEQIHQLGGVSKLSTEDLKRTAFYAVQEKAGATWTDWEGWAWAADFGDPIAEHQATRTACNLWDESPLRKWDLRGPDAVALVDALFTNDMAALEIGQVRYGALCDEQGKMVMDGTAFRLADDHCLSITSYDSDLSWFKRVASDRGLDVRVEDRTAQTPHLQIQGPNSRQVLGPITEGADVDTLRYFRFVHEGVRVGGVPCWLSRTGYSGELGFEVYCAPDDAEQLWDAVVRAGEPHGLRPIGLSAIETLRIESGLLFPDIDYFPHDTDPFEVRLDNVIKLDKPGDFVGRDALREIAAQGTPRLLTTLRIEGDQVPEYGATATSDGREVGIVRSPCQSPTFDLQVIAMAAIERDLVRDGQSLEVALGEGSVGAMVAPFPLNDTEKRRPRS